MDQTSREMMNQRPRDEELREQDLLSWLGKPRSKAEELREQDLLSWLGKPRSDVDCSLKLGPTVENIPHHPTLSPSPSPSLPQKSKGRVLIPADNGLKTSGSLVVVTSNNSSSNDNNMHGLNNIHDLLLGGGSGGSGGGGGSGSPSLIPSKVAEQLESGGESSANIGNICAICKSIKTPRWRYQNGPYDREIICNACSNRIKREEKKAKEMKRNCC